MLESTSSLHRRAKAKKLSQKHSPNFEPGPTAICAFFAQLGHLSMYQHVTGQIWIESTLWCSRSGFLRVLLGPDPRLRSTTPSSSTSTLPSSLDSPVAFHVTSIGILATRSMSWEFISYMLLPRSTSQQAPTPWSKSRYPRCICNPRSYGPFFVCCWWVGDAVRGLIWHRLLSASCLSAGCRSLTHPLPQAIWQNAYSKLLRGVVAFQGAGDNLNAALMHCNLAKLMRVGYCALLMQGRASDAPSHQERQLHDKAIVFYHDALKSLKTRATAPQIWDSITIDLGGAYLAFARLLQEPTATMMTTDVLGAAPITAKSESHYILQLLSKALDQFEAALRTCTDPSGNASLGSRIAECHHRIVRVHRAVLAEAEDAAGRHGARSNATPASSAAPTPAAGLAVRSSDQRQQQQLVRLAMLHADKAQAIYTREGYSGPAASPWNAAHLGLELVRLLHGQRLSSSGKTTTARGVLDALALLRGCRAHFVECHRRLTVDADARAVPGQDSVPSVEELLALAAACEVQVTAGLRDLAKALTSAGTKRSAGGTSNTRLQRCKEVYAGILGLLRDEARSENQEAAADDGAVDSHSTEAGDSNRLRLVVRRLAVCVDLLDRLAAIL
eukprot:m.49156 g.49156  ORF g.49156 m.49156 type:complete len:615 (+) comp6462_c0_seq4:191-2035(+)